MDQLPGLLDTLDLKAIPGKAGRVNPLTGLLNEVVNPPVLNQPDPSLITGPQRQQNFQNWFQGSQAVDEEGNPKVFYHGTRSNLKKFNVPSFFTDSPMEAGVYTGHQEGHIGWQPWEIDYDPSKHNINISEIEDGGSLNEDWWEPNKIYAVIGDDNSFTENGKQLQPYDLFYHEDKTNQFGDPIVKKIKGIKIYDETPDVDDINKRHQLIRDGKYYKGFTEIRRTGEKAKTTPPISGALYPVHLSIKNPKILHPLEANRLGKRLKAMTDVDVQKYIDNLKAQGYDGIKTESDIGHADIDAQIDWGGIPDQLIPFHPGQVKSLFNRGTYNRDDPDILSSTTPKLGIIG
jgi:hypothetical protein